MSNDDIGLAALAGAVSLPSGRDGLAACGVELSDAATAVGSGTRSLATPQLLADARTRIEPRHHGRKLNALRTRRAMLATSPLLEGGGRRWP